MSLVIGSCRLLNLLSNYCYSSFQPTRLYGASSWVDASCYSSAIPSYKTLKNHLNLPPFSPAAAQHAGIAQLGEQQTYNLADVGANPTAGATSHPRASWYQLRGATCGRRFATPRSIREARLSFMNLLLAVFSALPFTGIV